MYSWCLQREGGGKIDVWQSQPCKSARLHDGVGHFDAHGSEACNVSKRHATSVSYTHTRNHHEVASMLTPGVSDTGYCGYHILGAGDPLHRNHSPGAPFRVGACPCSVCLHHDHEQTGWRRNQLVRVCQVESKSGARVQCVVRCVAFGVWRVACSARCVACGTWHVECGTWRAAS